jgi:TolB protein
MEGNCSKKRLKSKDGFRLLIILAALSGCIQVKSLDRGQNPRLFEINVLPRVAQVSPTTSFSPIIISTGTITLPTIQYQTPSILPSTPIVTESPTLYPTPQIFTLTPEPTETKLTGNIAFVCEIFRNIHTDQICIMKADGSDYHRLTTNDSTQHRDPRISPNGNYIIYSALKDKYFQLFKMDLDSSSIIQQLTFDNGDSITPSISPDGNLIVYSFTQNDNRSVRILDQSTGKNWQIYGSPVGNGWNPVWSFDGSKIMFIAEFHNYIQLYIMNKDGMNYRRLSDLGEYHEIFDWSPNGNQISMSIGKNWERSIYILNIDNSLRIPAIQGSDEKIPSKSKDGDWIANNVYPNFSPNGNWIAYTSYTAHTNNNSCEIFVYNLDTGEKIQLTENIYCDYNPDWGP